MMKRTLCMLYAVVLLFAFVLPVYGAETGGGMNIQVSTNVINRPTFTVDIPSVIPLGELERTDASTLAETPFSVKVSGVSTATSQQIHVYVESDTGRFAMYCDGNMLPFEIYAQATGGDPLASGDLFASFLADGEQAGRISVDRADITASGVYAGTVRFTVRVTDAGSGE